MGSGTAVDSVANAVIGGLTSALSGGNVAAGAAGGGVGGLISSGSKSLPPVAQAPAVAVGLLAATMVSFMIGGNPIGAIAGLLGSLSGNYVKSILEEGNDCPCEN